MEAYVTRAAAAARAMSALRGRTELSRGLHARRQLFAVSAVQGDVVSRARRRSGGSRADASAPPEDRSRRLASGGVMRAEALFALEPAQHGKELVQQVHQLCTDTVGVQQPRDRAEQIAEEVPRSSLCRDVEDHAIEMNHQSK
jgi:hypothetical protein